jgi:hypothetical protein
LTDDCLILVRGRIAEIQPNRPRRTHLPANDWSVVR